MSTNPLIYVNAIPLFPRVLPDFQGPPGALGQSIVSLSDAAQARRRALAALDLVNHARQGCVGSSEPSCPCAAHDWDATGCRSRMCGRKPIADFELRRPGTHPGYGHATKGAH